MREELLGRRGGEAEKQPGEEFPAACPARGAREAGRRLVTALRACLRWLAAVIGRHRLFSAVLALAVIPRIIVMLGFQPAMLFKMDSYDYLWDAVHLIPNPVNPTGYSLILWLLRPFHSLVLIAAIAAVTAYLGSAQRLRPYIGPHFGERIAEPFGHLIRGYQRVIFLPGPVFALILLIGAVALLVPRSRSAAAAMLWASALILLVLPVAEHEYNYRYALPAIPLACMAAPLAFASRPSAAAPPGSADEATLVPASADPGARAGHAAAPPLSADPGAPAGQAATRPFGADGDSHA
jgi:hypothetical protein